ncbi:MAG TPA: hypothetical protein VF628_11210 [Allosphingosinicella sp.]|jgi:hypothetical protein
MTEPRHIDDAADLNDAIGERGDEDAFRRTRAIELALQAEGGNLTAGDQLMIARRFARFIIFGDTPTLTRAEPSPIKEADLLELLQRGSRFSHIVEAEVSRQLRRAVDQAKSQLAALRPANPFDFSDQVDA